VPGWNDYKPFLSNTSGKNIALWVFGHVHDYQRLGPAGAANQATAPVVLVAGGGGGSLDPSPADFQWQPAQWPKGLSNSNYNQVKISLTSTTISVEVRGTEKLGTDFKVIDSFSIPVTSARSEHDSNR
jgi:hypothetical protein